jgi:hypothetical protein
MAGVAIRWVAFVFLLAAGLAWLGSGEVEPHIVTISAGLMVIGVLWPYRHPRDLPPGLTVEASSRATRIPTIDLREVGHVER